MSWCLCRVSGQEALCLTIIMCDPVVACPALPCDVFLARPNPAWFDHAVFIMVRSCLIFLLLFALVGLVSSWFTWPCLAFFSSWLVQPCVDLSCSADPCFVVPFHVGPCIFAFRWASSCRGLPRVTLSCIDRPVLHCLLHCLVWSCLVLRCLSCPILS